MTKTRIKRLRKLLKRGSPRPWCEDDCNIFSKPMSDERHEAVMKIMRGELPDDADPARRCADHVYGFVATTEQVQPRAWEDAALIFEAVNALEELLDIAEAQLP